MYLLQRNTFPIFFFFFSSSSLLLLLFLFFFSSLSSLFFILFSFFCLISLVVADRLETYVLVLFILYYLIYPCTLLSFYLTILYCMSRILVSFVSINFIIIIIIIIISYFKQDWEWEF